MTDWIRVWILQFQIFHASFAFNQAWPKAAHAGFLEMAFIWEVDVPPRALFKPTNNWLNKFYCFSVFMTQCDISNKACRGYLPR